MTRGPLVAPEDQVIRRHIPEYVVRGRPLGRHVEHDPRSWAFRPDTAEAIIDVMHASVGLPINQGQAGSCTANALCAAANTAPNTTDLDGFPHAPLFSYPHDETDAVDLYARETADEGQPYPQYDPGGSGLAVCRAARELGWIKRWANAFTFDEAMRSLVVRPVITGINWYDSFDSPDSSGLVTISPLAQVRGGHEVCAVGIDTSQQLVVFWNSWGKGWGVGGMFAMAYGTWERLLAEQGDVTVPGAAVAR